VTAPKIACDGLPGWPRLFNDRLAAAYLSLGVECFRQHVGTGELPAALTLGRRRLWDRLALDAACDRLRGQGGSGRAWT